MNSGENWCVRWGERDVRALSGGGVTIPLTVVLAGQEVSGDLELPGDAAAVVYAQMTRLLCPGWARTEREQLDRQRGELYPSGEIQLMRRTDQVPPG